MTTRRPSPDPAIYAEGWSDIADAPRDGTWIELGFVNGNYACTPKPARTSGRGDAPNIWRFIDCGALRFSDERCGLSDGKPSRWRWRAIEPGRQAEIQSEYEVRRWGAPLAA